MWIRTGKLVVVFSERVLETIFAGSGGTKDPGVPSMVLGENLFIV